MRSTFKGEPPLRFRVFGVPVAQGRARIGRTRGHKRAVAFDPAKSRHWKTYVGHKLREYLVQLKLDTPAFAEGPLTVCVTCIFEAPKSMPKKLRRVLQPRATRPDCSNLLKLVEDAANGILWRDDSQISSATCIALNSYYMEPQTVIDVRAWQGFDVKEDILLV